MIGLILFMIVFFVFILPLTILVAVVGEYLIRSFALYRIAGQTGACNPKYAWIPVYQYWVMGKCAEECDAQTGRGGKKPWKWSKILLIMRISYLGAMIFLMPLAFLLAIFGGGILLQGISWLSIALTVFVAVCAFKMYRYYIDDPYDSIALVLTVLYPGWISTALLIASFFPPREQKASAPKADVELCGGAAVIVAQESDEG